MCILAFVYWYNCAMPRKVNFAIFPFLISSTRQELFAKVLECCFSFANKFCVQEIIFLWGNVSFFRGLRPCFIRLFQSDSNSVWAVSIFLSICHYCWDSSNHFLYAQNKILAIQFKKLPVKHSKALKTYSSFCLTWSSDVASFLHSSWRCTIKWRWLE